MPTLLRGGLLIEFEPASVEPGDLRIDEGVVVDRASVLEPREGDEVIELNGRLVMPGLVSAHHHLHAVLMRGAPRPPMAGFAGYANGQERLEAVLTHDDVFASARSSALEGLTAGTTTVLALHASPGCVEGSLAKVGAGLDAIGLRGVVAYELSKAGQVEQVLTEAQTFAPTVSARLKPGLGLTHLDALTDKQLSQLWSAASSLGVPRLVTVAEDPLEEARCNSQHDKSPVERLMHLGGLGPHTVVSQGVNLSWPDLSTLLSTGCWMAHASRSNMASQAGAATAAKFGVRGCLGTDTMPLDVLAEAQVAWLRAMDSGQPIDALHFIANGHRLASELLGVSLGLLRAGSAADIVVLDYAPTSPLTSDTLAPHVLHGFAEGHVESVMIDGIWRLWKRKPLGITVPEAARASREAATAVWGRLSQA